MLLCNQRRYVTQRMKNADSLLQASVSSRHIHPVYSAVQRVGTTCTLVQARMWDGRAPVPWPQLHLIPDTFKNEKKKNVMSSQILKMSPLTWHDYRTSCLLAKSSLLPPLLDIASCEARYMSQILTSVREKCGRKTLLSGENAFMNPKCLKRSSQLILVFLKPL